MFDLFHTNTTVLSTKLSWSDSLFFMEKVIPAKDQLCSYHVLIFFSEPYGWASTFNAMAKQKLWT